MRIAYFDCFSGISGDMTLGALVSAGVPFDDFRARLAGLGVGGYSLSAETARRSGIAAVSITVHLTEQSVERHLADIEEIISGSELPATVKERSISIFRRLAEAEARVHGTSPDKIHFHEVGGVDCIVDVVGSVLGLEMLGVERVAASPLPAGHGFVECSHGVIPVPAPATLELLRGVPVVPADVEGEMVTPTGAAIITALAAGFGPMPPMRPEAVGYGAGKKEFAGRPNLLRLVVGQEERLVGEATEVAVLEANIDDLNPEIYEHVMARLFAAGALDVYLTPVQMKKGRPAVLLTVLTAPERETQLANVVLAETTTLGVRFARMRRRCLEREFRRVHTPYGEVSVKLGISDGRVLTASPEYEECRRLAEERGVPLKEVYRAAASAVSVGAPGGVLEDR